MRKNLYERAIMDPDKKSDSKEKIIVSIDPDLKDIVPGFLEHRREDVKKILEAMEGDDFEGIRIIGHTMKGVGGGYGFDAITELGRFIEAAAKESNLEEIRRSVNELAAYIDNVEIVYE